ncbi:hypothetical protein HYC85_030653 [Camellia sinensis]|uniref:Disease resistance R13L4/SHOC-2-like LRR domain-containing protein n=1 Tax=Camellia sinensis TaxID=4442 RepID=A0A7J7G1E8_CAMSI|nr:hypothetical protein HYC85_030653 [Camellia sinensis]
MLELCLSKSKINDFLGIIHPQRETDLANCFSTTSSTTTTPKIRNLAIHLNRDVERVVLPELETTKHLRSILFCNSRSVYEESSIELNSHLKYFKLLGNLDFEGFKFDEKSVESIGNLISLRYLRFRGCLIPKWHSSICKLKHLQTLDLRYCKFNSGSCDVNDLCKLINLQQLEDATFWKNHNQDLAAFINYVSISADHLQQTSLSVEFCKKEEELTLLKQLLGCHHLYSLEIYGIIPELPDSSARAVVFTLERDPLFLFLRSSREFDARAGASACKTSGSVQSTLERLSSRSSVIFFYWAVAHPLWEHHFQVQYCQGFSPNLIELKLFGCELEEDPMPTLERLPNLQFLYFSGAFMGDKMVCSANGFPQLKTLGLYHLYHLKEWEVEKGAMPNLSALEIDFCPRLEMVPEGLRFIATLQRFKVMEMRENFSNKHRWVNGEEGEEFYKVQHVSSLDIW